MSPNRLASRPTAEVRAPGAADLSDTVAPQGAEASRPDPVCHVVGTFYPVVGGVQSITEEICARLAEGGQEVTVLTRGVAGAPGRERHRGFDIVRIGGGRVGPWASFLFVLKAFWALATELRRCRLVHVQNIDSPLLVGLLSRTLLGRTLVATIHGELLIIPMKETLSGRLRIRLMTRLVHRFTALSPRMEEQLAEEGVGPERIESIPNGVDVDLLQPAGEAERRSRKRDLGLSEDHAVALYLGRLHSLKRIDLILEAWGRRRSRAPASLVLVGEGPERPLLEDLIEREGLTDVVFAGEQRNVAPYLAASDFMMLTSKQEGLSIALLEAGAAGLPAIVSDLPGNIAVIEDGVNGVVVPVGDRDSITRALDRFLDDADGRRRMGVAARERVVGAFSIGMAVDRHLGMYRVL